MHLVAAVRRAIPGGYVQDDLNCACHAEWAFDLPLTPAVTSKELIDHLNRRRVNSSNDTLQLHLAGVRNITCATGFFTITNNLQVVGGKIDHRVGILLRCLHYTLEG